MRKFIFGAAAAFALVILSGAGGEPHAHGYAIKLAKIELSGAAGARTFTIDTGTLGYATVSFWFDYNYTANAGIVSLTCTGGPTASNTGYTLTVCDSASVEGECSAKTAGILKSEGSLSADTKWDSKLGIRGAAYLSCVAAQSGSPGAGEELTITYVTIAQ
jgi:hypothetical protein